MKNSVDKCQTIKYNKHIHKIKLSHRYPNEREVQSTLLMKLQFKGTKDKIWIEYIGWKSKIQKINNQLATVQRHKWVDGKRRRSERKAYFEAYIVKQVLKQKCLAPVFIVCIHFFLISFLFLYFTVYRNPKYVIW